MEKELIGLSWILGFNPRMTGREGGREKIWLIFDPTGSPLERGEGNKEDPLTFRLALNEG